MKKIQRKKKRRIRPVHIIAILSLSSSLLMASSILLLFTDNLNLGPVIAMNAAISLLLFIFLAVFLALYIYVNNR